MINDVKIFLDKVFQTELEAFIETKNPDLIFRNKIVEKLNAHCHDIMQNTMGVITTKYVKWTIEDYEKSKTFEKRPRKLFKISHYKNEKYGDVFVAYSSTHNPLIDTFRLSNCFFITKLENEFKIIGKSFVAREDYGTNWIKSHALDNMTLDTVGTFVSAERYLEPVDYEWDMKEYLADK
jgi:hypothetical protein